MQLDEVLHLPALAVDVLVKVLRRALERGDDVTDVDLLAHAGRGGFADIRLQRAFEPGDDFARTFPAGGLIHEARIGAQLRLSAFGVMKAQIVGGFGHHRIEYRIAGEAENIIIAVVFYPFHGFDAAVMTIAAPHDTGVRPMLLRRFVTCLTTVLTSVPFGVRAGRRMAATGVPLAT